MPNIDVPNGWIELRDPKLVSERLRRPIMAKASQLSASSNKAAEGEVDADSLNGMFEFNDLLAVALVKAWSFEEPITVDGMLDLPTASYDAIQKIVAPLLSELLPSFEASPEADSPTDPSDA
jgi:hypothetical protein